jgi:hypothetical protein
MNKELTILEYEPKVTTGGKKYARFKTSEGWMSCFDTGAEKELKERVGQIVNVEVIQKGDFWNIKGIAEGQPIEVVKIGAPVIAETKKSYDAFPQSMKVSYAKDCFCAIVTRISQASFDGMSAEERLSLMELCLKAVDKAIEHYK